MGVGVYDDSLWGKGYGYQAMELWINYLFDEIPEIVRLDVRTWSGNIGMKEEACFRNARIVDGEYYDSLAYGILRDEWRS